MCSSFLPMYLFALSKRMKTFRGIWCKIYSIRSEITLLMFSERLVPFTLYVLFNQHLSLKKLKSTSSQLLAQQWISCGAVLFTSYIANHIAIIKTHTRASTKYAGNVFEYIHIEANELHKSTPVATLFPYRNSLCFCSLPSSCLSRYIETYDIAHSIRCFHLAFAMLLLLQQQHTLLQLLQNCWDASTIVPDVW